MTTIANLAADFSIQAHEVLASLGIEGLNIADDTTIDSLEDWTEAEAREVLTIMGAQSADRS